MEPVVVAISMLEVYLSIEEKGEGPRASSSSVNGRATGTASHPLGHPIAGADLECGQLLDVHRHPRRWFVRCAVTRISPPRGVISSQNMYMNPLESAVLTVLPSMGQHSSEQGPSSPGSAAISTSSVVTEEPLSLSTQHDESQAVSSQDGAVQGPAATTITSPVLEQHSAAQAAASLDGAVSGVMAGAPVSEVASLLQQARAQAESPLIAVVMTIGSSGEVDAAHGVGQQSSGPANAANEIRPRPVSPMIEGASR
jgi:hypothetical protein